MVLYGLLFFLGKGDEYVGIVAKQGSEVIMHVDGGGSSELLSIPVSPGPRLAWFEPNPSKPYIACVFPDRLTIYDSRSKRETGTFRVIDGSIGGIRWKSAEVVTFSKVEWQKENTIYIYDWKPSAERLPKLTKIVTDRFQESTAVGGIVLPQSLPIPQSSSRQGHDWDLRMQGTLPFPLRRMAGSGLRFSIQAKPNGLEFFGMGTDSWTGLLSTSSSRFAVLRRSGEEVSATFVGSPKDQLWTSVYGIRRQLTDASENGRTSETYTTYFVGADGRLKTGPSIGFAVRVEWKRLR